MINSPPLQPHPHSELFSGPLTHPGCLHVSHYLLPLLTSILAYEANHYNRTPLLFVFHLCFFHIYVFFFSFVNSKLLSFFLDAVICMWFVLVLHISMEIKLLHDAKSPVPCECQSELVSVPPCCSPVLLLCCGQI